MRGLGVWILVHVAAAVIELSRANSEPSSEPSALDDVRGDAELRRDLWESEQTELTQSFASGLQGVGAAEIVDAITVEGSAAPREQTSFVEEYSDLGAGVVVEETIDLRHHLGIGRSVLPCSPRRRQRQTLHRSALEADVHRDLLGSLEHCHVLDEQAYDALSFSLRCLRIAPECGDVVRESKDARTRGVVKLEAIGITLALVLLLRVRELSELAVPIALELVRDEYALHEEAF